MAVKERRSQSFVYGLVQYMLVMYFPKDPIFLIVDDDERRWFVAQLEKVSKITVSRTASNPNRMQ